MGKMDKHCSSAGAIPADGAVALWSCVTRRILNDAGFQTSNENVPKKRVEFFTNLMYDESKNGKVLLCKKIEKTLILK